MATSKPAARAASERRKRIPVRWLSEPEADGPYDTTKRFRSNAELDAMVTEAAEWLGLSESEIIRAGIRMVDRLVKNQRYGQVLIDMAYIPGDGAKTRFK
ncbi:MAG: hypothetical protein KY455_05375 [Euryarchaeota archaeon]|nr:hypothetical protein [Euryarchaeota archaeon]